jgi:hypothetical protein
VGTRKLGAAGRIALALACIAGGSPVAADEGGDDPVPVTGIAPSSEDIVITGRGLDALDRYVDELTTTPNDTQLARWNDHICPRAVGVTPALNAYLAERIALIAQQMRIPVERGSCRANILVVVTEEADAFAHLLFQRHPKLFGAYGSGRPPAEAVDALLRPSPVRWLNASSWGNGQGAPVVDGNKNFVYSMSRLQETTRQNATLSLVIVDATKLEGVTWGGLSSYIAMVSLARPSPSAAPSSAPTILSLFRNRDAKRPTPAALTRWDREYLKGLYSAKANASLSAQRSQIRVQMKRELSRDTVQPSGD